MRLIGLFLAALSCQGALAQGDGAGTPNAGTPGAGLPATGITVTQILKTTQSWDGKPLAYPAGQAEVTGQIVEFAPGAETAWHAHPAPSFALILEGTLDVTLEDGRINHLHKGDAVAETVNEWHRGRNVGNTPVRLVVFYAGAAGQALTVKKQ